MFPIGGVGVMLAIIAAGAVACGGLAVAVRGAFGPTWAVTLALLVWSLVVIGAITLIPAHGAPGIVSAEGRLAGCSWDIGGPAPEGFWIFPGGQRLLNTVAFVPSGALLVLVTVRWRWWAAALVPAGLTLLAAYSVGIELTQLTLARIDRACDVTDVIDNVTGAVVGAVVGLALVFLGRARRRGGKSSTSAPPLSRPRAPSA